MVESPHMFFTRAWGRERAYSKKLAGRIEENQYGITCNG